MGDDDGEIDYVELEYLIYHGLPANLRSACADNMAVTENVRRSSRPALTRESKYMISARFNTREMVQICKDMKQALQDIGFPNVLLVDAAGGDQFGPMTMRYLHECDAIIGMITADYAERTSSPYCS